MAGSNPQTVFTGAYDGSTKKASAVIPSAPKHCPKIWILAPKGPTVSLLEDPTQLPSTYGAKAFDNTSKFYTHANHLLASMMALGCVCETQRVIPPDAGVKSNFTLWLDLLPVQVPNYQRNSDGTYLTDANGRPQAVVGATTVTGYKPKLVVTSVTAGDPTMSDSTLFGNKTSMVGDQTAGGVTSTRYPIVEFWADSFGADYNLSGFKLIAPNSNSSVAPNTTLMNAIGAYVYRLVAMRKATATSTPSQVNTVGGDSYFDFTFKAGQVNPNTGNNQVSLADIFKGQYTSVQAGYSSIYGDYSGIKVYSNYVNTVTGLLYAAEYAAASANGFVGSDLTQNPSMDETHKINFITAQSSSAVPYYAIIMNTTDANAVVCSESSTIYGQGGSDGTIAAATGGQYFDSLVQAKLANYADPNSIEANMKRSPGNVFYDSGFALATKYAFNNINAYRKDSMLYTAPYTVGGPALSNSDEVNIATALAARIRLMPESSVFNTPCFRACIMARHATDVNLPFVTGYQVPATLFWVARKNAALMGATSGSWNAANLYDNGQGDANIITDFVDWNVDFAGATTAATAWTACLNVPLPRDFSRQFMPVVRTVYSDPTSVLMSNLNAHIVAQLETAGYEVWAKYAGTVHLTTDQFIVEVTQYAQSLAKSTDYASMMTAYPVVTITGNDKLLGYRWKLVYMLGENNALYQQELQISVYRQSELPANSTSA